MTRGDGKAKFIKKLNLDKHTKKMIHAYFKLKQKLVKKND